MREALTHGLLPCELLLCPGRVALPWARPVSRQVARLTRKLADMKTPWILAALLAAGPTAWADEPKSERTLEIEVPVSVRTEIYLRESKRKAAAAADRLTGGDTFTRGAGSGERRRSREGMCRVISVSKPRNGRSCNGFDTFVKH